MVGDHHTTSTIDGPSFRNVSARNGAVELSHDDGRTTHFGAEDAPAQTPLVPEVAPPFAPMVGTVEDETLVVGPSRPGPELFGLATRVYTVDHDYTIVARVALVIRRSTRNRSRFTFTVADNGVSSAALRVAFSRGYGYALALHPEAFTGLPLIIDGTIEQGEPPASVAQVHVRAASLRQ